MVNKDLGIVTAYAYAVSKGYTGTEEEFAALMADYAEVGERAEVAATAAAASATAASGSASDSAASATAAAGSSTAASIAAGNASQAAKTATTKASEAAQSATAAAGSATTASTKASEAAQSALQAAGSATAAESAKTAAQTAQTAAETAQTAAETAQEAAEDAAESVSASAAQIAQNTADISDAKSRIEQIDATLIVNEASGAIATFTDGSDGVPMRSVMVDMEPIQNLNGQDAPYPAGGGVNIMPVYPVTKTADPSVTTDGDIYTINGTAAEYNQSAASKTFTLPAGDYYFQAFTVSGTGASNVQLRSADGLTTYANTTNSGGTAFNLTESTEVKFRITWSAGTFTNLKIQCMVSKGTTAPTAYAPYSNICPISGRDTVTVTMAGKNLCFITASTNNRVIARGLKAGVTYTFSMKTTGSVGVGLRYNVNGVNMGMIASGEPYTQPITFTPNMDCDMFINGYSNVSGTPFSSLTDEYQLEVGSTASTFEPYTADTITIPLGDTVYGGTVDAVSGVMTVDRAYLNMADIPSWSTDPNAQRFYKIMTNLAPAASAALPADGLICNRFASISVNAIYANTQGVAMSQDSALQFHIDGLTDVPNFTNAMVLEYFANNPTYVVAKLAQPVTVQLTAQQLTTLLGTNNVWSDADSVTVDYVADTKLYIEQLTEPDADMVADANITSGAYFMVGNALFLATANIASGAAIVPGVNCTRTNLAEALNALNA